jgi:hypothetical protein
MTNAVEAIAAAVPQDAAAVDKDILQLQQDLTTLSAAIGAHQLIDGVTDTSSGGANAVILSVSGDDWPAASTGLPDPQFTVAVDGVQIGGTQTVTAVHGQGQWQSFTITGSFTAPKHIAVTFLNDAYGGSASEDVNLYVASLSVNGFTFPGRVGAYSANNGVTPIDPTDSNAAAMFWNGTLAFDTSGATPSAQPVARSNEAPAAAATPAAAPAPASAPLAAGFYVSPAGSDGNPGTLAAPFATLAKAQAAMRASSTIKTAYLRAGQWNLTSTLVLTSADASETWQYYPPDGVNSAILDGGNSIDLVTGTDCQNFTWNGIKLQNFHAYGINMASTESGSAENTTIINTDAGFNLVNNAVAGFQSGAIVLQGNVANSTIANNYVHDCGSQGISVFDGYSYAGNVGGTVIKSNVALRCVQVTADGACIYVSGHGGGTFASGSGITIENNYVADYGGAANQTPGGGIGLDDNASNTIVKGNVIGPPGYAGAGNSGDKGGSSEGCFGAHNGENNVFTGNICDLGATPYAFAAVFFHDSDSVHGMGGTVVEGNIFLSNFTGPLLTNSTGTLGFAYFQNGAGADYAIQNNVYWNDAAGGSVFSNGNLVNDSNPINENPQVSGWTYAIAAGSPVLAAPVSFPPIAGGWGPPGFVIPETGTPPSSPR